MAKEFPKKPGTRFGLQKSFERELEKFYKECFVNFHFFARTSLRIRNKEGAEVPLETNEAQHIIHTALEKQLQDTGKIRAVILKGRQQGVSTYVQGRFFWKLLHNSGLRAFILTHLAESTQSLFGMAKRFVDGLPIYKPMLGKCNQNELYMNDIDCGYKVGTAGSSGVGRGETLQLVHGSEVSYWPKSEEHFAGILQAVPNSQGTEIILESTANQMGNVFYRMVMKAMEPNSGWQLIFVPWYVQKEYSMENEKIKLTEEEDRIKKLYKLNNAQIAWRRHKIEELGDERKFRQEYPSNVHEAFIGDSDKSFITRVEIDKANSENDPIVTDPTAPLIIGIDPAGKGKDDSAYAVRCGRILKECGVFPDTQDTMALVGHICLMINKYKPDRVFIDCGGLGAPIYDRLRERGYSMVRDINFGSRPDDTERYANKRAEMYDQVKRWLNSPPCQIPSDENLRLELALTEWTTNSSGKLLLSPKRDLVKSPNLADAFALTFAEKVLSNILYQNITSMPATKWNPYDLGNKR